MLRHSFYLNFKQLWNDQTLCLEAEYSELLSIDLIFFITYQKLRTYNNNDLLQIYCILCKIKFLFNCWEWLLLNFFGIPMFRELEDLLHKATITVFLDFISYKCLSCFPEDFQDYFLSSRLFFKLFIHMKDFPSKF